MNWVDQINEVFANMVLRPQDTFTIQVSNFTDKLIVEDRLKALGFTARSYGVYAHPMNGVLVNVVVQA